MHGASDKHRRHFKLESEVFRTAIVNLNTPEPTGNGYRPIALRPPAIDVPAMRQDPEIDAGRNSCPALDDTDCTNALRRAANRRPKDRMPERRYA